MSDVKDRKVGLTCGDVDDGSGASGLLEKLGSWRSRISNVSFLGIKQPSPILRMRFQLGVMLPIFAGMGITRAYMTG